MTGTPVYLPYEPQLLPKSWSEDIWTVDGPDVACSLWGLTIPCPTRMTIIGLPSGDLWVHSPVACTPDLVAAVKALGPVAAIIAYGACYRSNADTEIERAFAIGGYGKAIRTTR